MADRQRLQQVLLNLLSNAVKYNREGGAVSISYDDDGPAGRVRLTSRTRDRDRAREDAPAVHTVRSARCAGDERRGHRARLALSKGLVELMGGSLRAESTIGHGSRFTVELPIAESPTRELERGRHALGLEDDAPGVRGTVLYIEDNPANLRLVERIVARRPGVTLLSAMQEGAAWSWRRRIART